MDKLTLTIQHEPPYVAFGPHGTAFFHLLILPAPGVAVAYIRKCIMAQTVITVADLANFKFADGESFEIAFETSGSDKDPKTGKVIKRNPIKLIGIVDVSGLTLDVLGWAGVKEAKTKEAGAISQNFDCEQIDLFKSDLKQVDDAYEHRFMFTQAGSIRPQETLTQVRDEMIARLEQRKGRKLKKSEIDAIDTILAS